MRLKYYKLTLRQMSLKKSFVFFLITLVTMLILSTMLFKNVMPKIEALCISAARSVALKCTNSAVLSNIEDITYTDLITMQKDDKGKITALSANISEMNKLSNKISTQIITNLENNTSAKVKLPIISLIGADIFGGYGPDMEIKLISTGDVETEFVSQFETAGINQTKHRIYIRITTEVRNIAPFLNQVNKYTNDVLVAESVIIGDIPSSYYNIQGINGIEPKDTLELID